MKDTFAVLNQMVADGAIENYALAGAVGAIFYVEPFSTEDIDVLVMAEEPKSQLIIEIPGLEYLREHGYKEIQREGIMIEGWPVQFLPATSALEREAYLNAETSDFDGIPVNVVLAEHLVAIMLSVGRLKDLARIEMFLSQEAVKIDVLEDTIKRHSLDEKWNDFRKKFLR
jgi:hypothetical protein